MFEDKLYKNEINNDKEKEQQIKKEKEKENKVIQITSIKNQQSRLMNKYFNIYLFLKICQDVIYILYI